MTANNMTILNQDSTPEEYAALPKGRYVTDITVSSHPARQRHHPRTHRKLGM